MHSTGSLPSTPLKGLTEVHTNCFSYKENLPPRLSLSPCKISSHLMEKPSLEDLKKLNKSTVSHLRTLSKLTSGNGSEGLCIPGVTKGAEDVTGLQGRVRLQKAGGSRLFSWSKTWMDKQRANIQAYEYLCHIGEAKEWIESCIGEEIPVILELEESLRDGVILARLVRVFAPDLVPKIFEASKLQFRHSDNINRFFQFIERMNLPNIFRFELTDLYEKKNIPKVIYCIHALSFLLSHVGLATSIGNLVGKLEFTDEEINNTQRDLDIAGVSLPNFRNIGNAFSDEMNISEEKKMSQSSECSSFEKDVFILNCQTVCRGFLLRKKLLEKFQDLLYEEDMILILQAYIRGFFVRKVFSKKVIEYRKFKEWTRKIQAVSRGYIIRKLYLKWKKSVHCYDNIIINIQAVIRGNLLRKHHLSLKNDLVYNKNSIIKVQSYSRGMLFRHVFDTIIMRFQLMRQYSIPLQAQCRGVIIRKRLQDALIFLYSENDAVILFQSHIRGVLVRKRFNNKMKYYKENMQKIIKIQSLVRGKLQGQAYRNLTMGKNPPISAIKNFVHLLNDNNFDFEEEIEMESLRKMIVQRVRANENAEEHIDQLDLKIALLVKNAITLDEVIRHQKRFSSKNLLHSFGRSLENPFDLKALNKSSREKLELYQGFFFLLQTCPEYFARLFSSYCDKEVPEKNIKQLENFVMCIFGYAQKRREEYFLLRLLRRCIIEELIKVENIQEFFKRDSLWIKIAISYSRNIKERKYFKKLFEPLKKIIGNDHLDLESNPVIIYLSIINKEELMINEKNNQIDFEKTEALRDPETRDVFIKHLQDLRDCVEKFIDAIEITIHEMPYGLRYIARETYRTLLTRFPDESPLEALKFIGYIIYYRYLNPIILAPDSLGIIEGTISVAQRKNLAEISKILVQITTGKLFDKNDIFLQPLNVYIESAIQRMVKIFRTAIDVQDAERYFEMDEFDDLTSTQKPILYIKISDIFTIHSLVYKEIEIMAPDQDDQLRDIIKQLGSLSNNDEFIKMSDIEIDLTLSPRLVHIENSDSENRSLFIETKHYILYIIRIQTGSNLMEILIKPVHANDEIRWRQILAEESNNNTSIYSISNMYNLRKMSFSEIKASTLENILKLESRGIVSRNDNYQGLLNAIAMDIRTKHRRRLQRQAELESARQTLAHLDEKALYLKSQLESYNDYIEKSLTSLQAKKGKRKPIIPFTKQYFHLRDLRRSGQMPKFGSHKYSGRQLFDKGVIVSISGQSEKDYGKFDFTISSNDIGIFTIETALGPFHTPTSLKLKLDDLLQAQYDY
ncbi:hypothetical protein PORY_001438 [Pneumocystis oryctolagi]|uniref:Uncharacterized protein n=1 Tax=Pneumocystis oryctolagi TaxID=42067 RepID=A0ACB7CE81_9ASCO|nr:hypothetical protein PORY_001438 [Pneumocystis oryctolagi]